MFVPVSNNNLDHINNLHMKNMREFIVMEEFIDIEKLVVGNLKMNVKMEYRKIRDVWKDWIPNILNEYRKRFVGANNPYVLYVTIVPKRNQSDDMPLGRFEMELFHKIYRKTCYNAIGNRYSRAQFRDFVPMAVGFIDCEESKFAAVVSDATNIHVHSIWECHPENMEKIIAYLESLKEVGQVDGSVIDSIDVRVAKREDAAAMVDYSYKWIGLTNDDPGNIDDQIAICPDWIHHSSIS